MDEKLIKQEIQKLVDKFERIKVEGKYKKYNEENTKKDFILPLFRILGWNVEDSAEVKAEEKVSKKRVDYAFKIDGYPKFYLECKPFRENINDVKYAKQAIEYAWNKSVTWAILCNFEEIKIFNAEWKWNDKQPMRNQFIHLRYTDFLGKYLEQLMLLSKESMRNKKLDEQATVFGKKTKKLPISNQLLADFTEYRNLLSKDILKNNVNKDLTQDELDEIVQRILDRIIFIRTCEDKEIESEKLESLVRIFENKDEKLYKELNKKFREYDKGYNSKLFREHLCEKVFISNDTLKQVILGTYRSGKLDIRYDFSAINADILGNIYEQYLGHILKSTAKRAKLTNGKVHRTEQGIYYTPTYIVDFIVRNTLGEKLKKQRIKIDELRILDLACGSGSFLLKAFDILSEYTTKKEGIIQQTKFENISEGKLLKRKTELLKNTIFGVDLDSQAVEIAQLNLLLKLAEKRHRLPTLMENIRCGNSLIDDPNVVGIKSFIWGEEFENIINNGGFDVIIGNPPYDVLLPSQRDKEFVKQLEFLRNNELYKPALGGRTNLFRYMTIRALTLLNKNGYFGYIIPLPIINDTSSTGLRKFILDNFQIISIDCFPQKDNPNDRVFFEAKLSTCIIIASNKKPSKEFIVRTYTGKDFSKDHKEYRVSAKDIKRFDPDIFSIPMVSEDEWNLLKKLHSSDCYTTIKKIASSHQGEMNITKYKKHFTENPHDLEMLKGVEIGRFKINKFIKQGKKEWFSKDDFNNMKDTFRRYDHIMSKRITTQQITGVDDSWRVKAVIIKTGTILANTTNYLIVKDGTSPEFLCGILNSKLIDWRFRKTSANNHVNTYELDALPIPKNHDKKSTNKIIDLVKQNQMLNRRLVDLKEKQTDEKLRLEKEIKKIDKQIDEFVYKLYGLNKEEISVVEQSIKN